MPSMIRWSVNPGRDLLGIRDDVDRLFASAFHAPAQNVSRLAGITPPVDIEATQDEFVVRADLPGVAQQDVKVSLLGDVLTIRGERKQVQETTNQGLHRAERRYGSFERSFSLGVAVRADQVKANFRDGVLEIHVPKAEEARVREIEVQVAS